MYINKYIQFHADNTLSVGVLTFHLLPLKYSSSQSFKKSFFLFLGIFPFLCFPKFLLMVCPYLFIYLF
uniref:Uncharacterized protein n=1 Tax=Meloidogyne enterolobii TaxID=390850 RepID=A0A6V7Y093_MELEN|nr:unnamed protein product [Meloidogyne enterolobii]